MKHTIPTDEELMAYADGEVDDKRREEIREISERDPAVRQRLALFISSSSLTKQAVDQFAGGDVPDTLRESITKMIEAKAAPVSTESNVVSIESKRKRPVFTDLSWAQGIAATLAIAASGSVGYMANNSSDRDSPSSLISMAAPVPGAMATALGSLPSGSEALVEGDKLRLITTLRGADNTLCREFEVDETTGQTVVAVACRNDGQWIVKMAVAANKADTGYAPASSLAAVEAYLGQIGAGESLSLDAEKEALASPK